MTSASSDRVDAHNPASAQSHTLPSSGVDRTTSSPAADRGDTLPGRAASHQGTR